MAAPSVPVSDPRTSLAAMAGVSGGRFTLGIGVGLRPDDFVVEGLGVADRGRRLDRDLEIYRSVWSGEPIGGGSSPAVPSGTRQIPLIFGAGNARALKRMAEHGEGFVSPSVPTSMAGTFIGNGRAAWREAGRAGEPRLIGLAYYALGDPDKGRANVADYYAGPDEFLNIVVGGVLTTPAEIVAAVKEYEALGAEEVLLNPTNDDLGEISRLADVVL